MPQGKNKVNRILDLKKHRAATERRLSRIGSPGLRRPHNPIKTRIGKNKKSKK